MHTLFIALATNHHHGMCYLLMLKCINFFYTLASRSVLITTTSVVFSAGAPSGSVSCTDVPIAGDAALQGESQFTVSAPGVPGFVAVTMVDSNGDTYIIVLQL